jgi:hypothetical protein
MNAFSHFLLLSTECAVDLKFGIVSISASLEETNTIHRVRFTRGGRKAGLDVLYI